MLEWSHTHISKWGHGLFSGDPGWMRRDETVPHTATVPVPRQHNDVACISVPRQPSQPSLSWQGDMLIPVYSHQLLCTEKPTLPSGSAVLSLQLSVTGLHNDVWVHLLFCSVQQLHCGCESYKYWKLSSHMIGLLLQKCADQMRNSVAKTCNIRFLPMCGHEVMLSFRISMMRSLK